MLFPTSVLVLALTASAIATPGASNTLDSQCDTGSQQCCLSTTTLSNAPAMVQALLSGLDVQGLIGLQCTPITGVGIASGSKCNQEPVCCDNVMSESLIGLDCSPINVL